MSPFLKLDLVSEKGLNKVGVKRKQMNDKKGLCISGEQRTVWKNGPKSKGVLWGHAVTAVHERLTTDDENNCDPLVQSTVQPWKNVYKPCLTYFYPPIKLIGQVCYLYFLRYSVGDKPVRSPGRGD